MIGSEGLHARLEPEKLGARQAAIAALLEDPLFFASHLIHCLHHMPHYMESIEHDFGIGVGHVLPDGCAIRLPHVHRNRLDRRTRLEGEASEIRVQAFRGTIIGDVEHRLLVEIDDHRYEREVPQIGMLIDTESPASDVRPAREAATHRALDNAVGFFPREAESARYCQRSCEIPYLAIV